MTRKFANAALGFGLGIFTLPLILVAWPFVAAWWMWQETDDNYDEGEKELSHTRRRRQYA